MSTRAISNWFKKWTKLAQGRKPHPAIFAIDAINDLCPLCLQHKRLEYVDREMGEAFCEDCLECVEAADRNLAAALFERPDHRI
jgi:hypothetical protein